MYDTVQLRQEDWCLQCYIWQRDWDKSKIPEEKIIKTLISGVKSSGDQAEWGLRETAKLLTKEYPLINQIVQNDIYVDDCLSGENTRIDSRKSWSDRIGTKLRWLFTKRSHVHNRNPSSNFSADDCSDNMARMKQFPKEDISTVSSNFLGVPVGSRGKGPENFGYFTFWIAENISLVVICLFLD